MCFRWVLLDLLFVASVAACAVGDAAADSFAGLVLLLLCFCC